MDKQPFGERVRELRKAKAMTQKELADRVSIDFTYLSKLETGKADPPGEDVVRGLARALGADPEELVYLAGKVPKALRGVVASSSAIPVVFRALRDGTIDDEELKSLVEALRARKQKGK